MGSTASLAGRALSARSLREAPLGVASESAARGRPAGYVAEVAQNVFRAVGSPHDIDKVIRNFNPLSGLKNGTVVAPINPQLRPPVECRRA